MASAATVAASDLDTSPQDSARNKKSDISPHCASCALFVDTRRALKRHLPLCAPFGGIQACLFGVTETLPERPRNRLECELCPHCQRLRDEFEAGEDVDTHCASGHDWDQVISRSRPCVFVGCRYNNFLNVAPLDGRITWPTGYDEPNDVDPEWSCAMDVAERGGQKQLTIANGLRCVHSAVQLAESDAFELLREHARRLRDG